MASNMSCYAFFVLLASIVLAAITQAADPDLLTDFMPGNQNGVNASFFTNTGFRGVADGKTPAMFKVTKASVTEFPALLGQSVSMALLQYPPASINPLHTHPRSAELLYVLEGSLDVGLIDTTNKLFTKTLMKGDLFVFPKGLVHFQQNTNAMYPAVALSAFGSANAGTVPLPTTLFASGLDAAVLSQSFKTDIATVRKITAGLAPKA